MNADQWKRLKQLREKALELDGAQREAFLAEQCADDHELLAELRRLLCETEVPTDFLNPPDFTKVINKDWEHPSHLGEFELIAELGRGGTGVVFLARQPGLDRLVAVKALAPYVTRTQRDVDRFNREGRAVSRLNHPGIVSIYSVGHEADTPYFAMQYVEGHSLFEELRILRGEGQPGEAPILPAFDSPNYLHEVVKLCARMCEALQYAHDQGVVHRDIKPHNLLLDLAGNPLIADFGLARIEEFGSISKFGDVLGTVHYMSPEQARMLKVKVDNRTDVYSMGVVLYELLTLARPFEGNTSHEILQKIAWVEPVPVRTKNPAVARDLEIICEGAIAKDPNRRYGSAGELAAELTRFLEHKAILRKPPTKLEKAWIWARSHQTYLAAAMLLLVAIVAGAEGQHLLANSERAEQMRGELASTLEHFDELSAQQVMAVLERARELEGGAALGGGDLVVLRQLEQRCASRSEELSSEGHSLLADLLKSPNRTDLKSADFGREPQLVEGIEALTSAAVLSGSVDSLADDLVRLSTISLLVRIKPEEMAANANIYIRPLDPYTDKLGELRSLGSYPIGPVQLSAGHYRIIVDQPGVGFAELKRWFPQRGREYEVEAWIRPGLLERDGPPGGMLRIAASPYELDLPLPTKNRVQIESFWVDQSLVTNAEYEQFLVWQGRSAKKRWESLGELQEDWPLKPATKVSIAEARSYAEWKGKRLLTQAEWELAARGPEKRIYPWGDEFDQARFELFNVGQPDWIVETQVGMSAEVHAMRWYNKYVRAVADLPEDCRGPNGLLGTLGNVWEWVDSSSFNLLEEGLVLVPHSFFRVGGSSDAPLGMLRSRGLSLYIWGGEYPEINTGFRCAKSVTY